MLDPHPLLIQLLETGSPEKSSGDPVFGGSSFQQLKQRRGGSNKNQDYRRKTIICESHDAEYIRKTIICESHDAKDTGETIMFGSQDAKYTIKTNTFDSYYSQILVFLI